MSACATVTPVAGRFPPITPYQAQSGADDGRLVRWGGRIVHTEPGAQQTCFQLLALPLNSEGRPKIGYGQTDLGRFMACVPGFYDPRLYSAGREMTCVGRIVGVQSYKVGNFVYKYPRIEVGALYLWPLPKLLGPPPQWYITEGFGYYWGRSSWWWGYP